MTLKELSERVESALERVGYAPFDTKDNVEMFYTLQLVSDILRKEIKNEKHNG